MEKIYFDYASTTPVDPEVVQAMMPYFFEKFGNAASPHAFGREAQKALEEARETLAGLIGAAPEEIVFCSGATEANNHAILGVARANPEGSKHILVASIEHHAVLEPVKYLEKAGYRVTSLKVDATGQVSPDDVKKAVREPTTLMCVMHASNEVGTIQPVAVIGAIAQEHKIPFLVDAVQTVGHVPVNVRALAADLLSLSAHKFYGPKGIGALYIRKGTKVARFLLGGDQERGRRGSTQNVAGAVGMAKALELCVQRMTTEAQEQTRLRDRLLVEIPQRIQGVKVNGHLRDRLPNNAHFSFQGLETESLLMGLDMAGVAASMGSACSSGAMEPSHVLKAMGLAEDFIYGSLRLTIGRWTTEAQIAYLLEQLPGIVRGLRI
ncbi:MAG TPA: cysteine desulfurase NifS [Candidatus Omnitrophica bacterium]|nr:MAG: cysteine desulfurase NifS [Omnitrophica WOR_2 bacterium GWA2_45_18]HBR14413.1 cysteine desulfurase NifS [Candidatus Omnitrophota bacterium]